MYDMYVHPSVYVCGLCPHVCVWGGGIMCMWFMHSEVEKVTTETWTMIFQTSQCSRETLCRPLGSF